MESSQLTFFDAWILDLGDGYTRNIKKFSREKNLPDILRLTEREEEERKCFKCGTVEGELVECLLCRRASYCSASCQSSDWARHRRYCAILQQMARN